MKTGKGAGAFLLLTLGVLLVHAKTPKIVMRYSAADNWNPTPPER